MIHHGDCLDVMAEMPPESVDAIVTDPPYDLVSVTKRFGGDKARNTPAMETEAGSVWARKARGFMGKSWDGTGVAFRVETWVGALRVAKPGAHLLAFGGTRTYHRMAVAIEDAGWEIRDCLVWAYASGFPKSLNFPDGWGTALKPAWEPIIMARKPLIGTVAANRELHGTGALNIEATRIGTGKDKDDERWYDWQRGESIMPETGMHAPGRVAPRPAAIAGRWPANVILTDAIFDSGVDGVVGGGDTSGSGPNHVLRRGGTTGAGLGYGSSSPPDTAEVGYEDSGTYSRFYLIPKADRADREPVLGGLPEQSVFRVNAGGREAKGADGEWDDVTSRWVTRGRQNHHPTVKPTDLMRHLVRLVTPPEGVVLDPFAGSGSTLIAAELEGFSWIGIEKEAEYVAIAEARLNGTQRGMGLSDSAPPEPPVECRTHIWRGVLLRDENDEEHTQIECARCFIAKESPPPEWLKWAMT